MSKTILVCGGRNYSDYGFVNSILSMEVPHYHDTPGGVTIIQGGSTGADSLARRWANLNRITSKTFKADWDTHGLKAGPIRNAKMLKEGKPDLVIAFPGGKGTNHMVSTAEKAGVPVLDYRSKGL
jgi:hypothetical protein